MINHPKPSITVNVDVTNPGQFFACCGLLELADRLWPGAEGWFTSDEQAFCITSAGSLDQLFGPLTRAGLTSALTPTLAAERETLDRRSREAKKAGLTLPKQAEERRKELGKMFREGNILIASPFNLLLDWWQSDDDSNPKTWAGSQAVIRIAQAALDSSVKAIRAPSPFDFGCVMRAVPDSDDMDMDVEETGKKVEPFYFDSRRAPNAHSRDIGFAPNDLNRMTTIAFPAVEFLALVGLQRARPSPTDRRRVFEYCTWRRCIEPSLLSAAVAGHIRSVDTRRFQFENWFRTGEKKHKAFRSAIPHTQGV